MQRLRGPKKLDRKEENKLICIRESERRLKRAQLLRAGRGLRREASGKNKE